MKKILVTGGAGFIGANFVHYWLNKYDNDEVVVLDALTYAGNLANLASVQGNTNFEFVHGDICDQELVEQLIRNHRIDTIVHFAAESVSVNLHHYLRQPPMVLSTCVLCVAPYRHRCRVRQPIRKCRPWSDDADRTVLSDIVCLLHVVPW